MLLKSCTRKISASTTRFQALRAPDGTILTRWSLDAEEKKLVLEQGYIYLAVSTFNQPLQPVLLSATPIEGFKTRPLEEWPTEIEV